MAQLIIIRGGQNGGKTTTIGLVYQELLKHSELEHIFNDNIVTQDSLRYNDNGETIDFTAILTINSKKIGLVSAGDVASHTKVRITIFIEMKIDIVICCARSVNRDGSTYRMILEDFSQTNNIALEIFTGYDENKLLKNEIKKTTVENIVKKALEIIG